MLIFVIIAVAALWIGGSLVVLALCRTAHLGDELEERRRSPPLPGASEPVASASRRDGSPVLQALTGRFG